MEFSKRLQWPNIARRNFLRLAGVTAFAQVAQAGTADRPAPPAAPGADATKQSTPPSEGQNVWGYANKHSVREGETFNVMLSTGPGLPGTKGKIEFFRVGPSPEQAPVWTEEVSVDSQEMLATSATVGAGWYPATTIDPSGWQSGVYLADFVDARTGRRDAAVLQMIVRGGAKTRDVLVKLGTNTYQAYNDWGGHSLYEQDDDPVTRGAMVSFDRPGKAAFLEYDLFLVRWIEALAKKHGFSADYASNHDIHRDKHLACLTTSNIIIFTQSNREPCRQALNIGGKDILAVYRNSHLEQCTDQRRVCRLASCTIYSGNYNLEVIDD